MRLAILGATGSIGRNALDLAGAFPLRIQVTALSCACQVLVLARAIMDHRPRLAAVAGPGERRELLEILSDMGCDEPPEVLCGPEGYAAVAAESEADVVLSAISGLAGLPPTLAALERGRKVALANKESLVAGGELLMPLARRTGAEIIPVDSEHSALFQLLGGLYCSHDVRRLILTASGGPFRGLAAEALAKATLEEALAHPRWRMGPQVTCDSATLMNKGLELIEAHHLFGLPYDRMEVLVHPESLVHGLVEYVDGSQAALLSQADMRVSIAYALSHPKRWPLLSAREGPGLADFSPLDLAALSGGRGPGRLTFETPDHENFPALRLAEEAGREGGTAPAVLLGANEEAVKLFLAGLIGFLDIHHLVRRALEAIPAEPLSGLEQIQAVSGEASHRVRNFSLDLRR